MSHRNLIPMIKRLAKGRKKHLIKHIEELMKDPKNKPILEELTQFVKELNDRINTRTPRFPRIYPPHI